MVNASEWGRRFGARADMKRELDLQCKKMRPAHAATAADAEALVLTVQSYLKMKLGPS